MKRKNILKQLALTLSIFTMVGITTNTVAYADEWQWSNNNWYYVDGTGNSKTGWINDKGNWYYNWSDGSMATNQWIQSGDKWYYLGSNGAMVYNTVIDGCTIGNNGYWVIGDRGALTWEDVVGNHQTRGDIASRTEDLAAADLLSNYNIDFSSDNKEDLDLLATNLAKGKIYLEEAKNSCIGKTIAGKYKITDIKFLNKIFSTTTGSSIENKVNAIKNSDLYENNVNSNYKYDKFLVYTCGNARASEWEAIRIIIEFEA